MALNGLPKVSINYSNGALGQTVSSADGLLCLVVCGLKTTNSNFENGKPYSIRKLGDLADLGITRDSSELLYDTVADFYKEAPEGTQVYVAGFSEEMADVLDKEQLLGKQLIESTNGSLRGLVVTSANETEDIDLCMLYAQSLGDWSTDKKYAPIFTILDYVGFDGVVADLPKLTEYNYNRVGVVIGSTEKSSPNQAVGLVAGRIARSSVDNNIGRVADNALNTLTMYAGDKAIELADTESIYEKGYITFRTFTGKAGYYISDDTLATSETDDYNHLTARRTIDKAYRFAYAVLVEKLLDKVEVRSNGTMSGAMIAAWEQMVHNAVSSNMAGELSDDGDGGVVCVIDSNQDILSTSTIEVELRVRPFGYARYINVTLGFTVG